MVPAGVRVVWTPPAQSRRATLCPGRPATTLHLVIWFIAIPVVIVWVIGIVDILRGPMSGGAKAGWIVLVLVLPIVGTIIYFATRKPTKEQGALRDEARKDLHGAGPGGGVGPPPPSVS
jgi:hypothetical protein